MEILSFFKSLLPSVKIKSLGGFGNIPSIFQGGNRPIFRAIVEFLGGEFLAQRGHFFSFNLFDIVSTGSKGTSDSHNSPSCFGRESHIQHRGPDRSEHIQIYWALRDLLGCYDNFFSESNTLQTAADAALEYLEKSGSTDQLGARREIEDVIARTYGLCTLFEIMEIEKYRNKGHLSKVNLGEDIVGLLIDRLKKDQ